jgi:FtsP/CotA-like multicopper oxidase with cupredoxin domain
MKIAAVSISLALTIGGPVCSAVDARGTAAAEIHANDNRKAAGVLSRGQLRLELEAREGLWYPETHDGPAIPVQAFAERGKPLQVPGPVLRVAEGTRIRATVRNLLAQKLVLHGLYTRPGDGKTAIELAPGERRDIEFPAGAPGTYYYWGSTMQGGPVSGFPAYRDAVLSGAFIVDPKAQKPDPDERIFMVSKWHQDPALDDPRRYGAARAQRRTNTINGLAWPYTERLVYEVNKAVRWRWINVSYEPHPLHLHGFYFELLSLGDGNVDRPFTPELRPRVVTHRLREGETMSVVWTPERSGNWLFHCHILDHIGPHTRLRPPARHEAGGSHHKDHARDAMSGLVLGVTVRADASRTTPAQAEPRRMKLFVQEQPGRFGERAALGYALQKGGQEPGRDSVDIPGPLLLLTRGEHTAVEIVNRTREETSVHWHGMELESYYDGVPGWGGDDKRTTPPIRPNESFVAHMTPPRAGTFIYHTHWHDEHQLSSGMSGPLVVLEPGKTYDPEVERMVFVSVAPPTEKVSDPILINGSLTPVPLQMKVGNTYRLRLVNITADNGNFDVTLASAAGPVVWRAIAKDGADLPTAQAVESQALRQSLTTGETRDYEFRPESAGDLRFDVRAQNGRVRGTLIIEVR